MDQETTRETETTTIATFTEALWALENLITNGWRARLVPVAGQPDGLIILQSPGGKEYDPLAAIARHYAGEEIDGKPLKEVIAVLNMPLSVAMEITILSTGLNSLERQEERQQLLLACGL